MLKVIDGGAGSNQDNAAGGESYSPIDEIVREGARRMLAAALQAEVAAYVEQFADRVDHNGRRLVVRNGYHVERTVLTSAGAVEVRAPRINDNRVDPETGERKRFSSAILPARCRRSPQISEVPPLLYLHGLSTGGPGAVPRHRGRLSASAITRLTAQWQDVAKAFAVRDLSNVDYVYLWVDGIHLKVRLEQEKLCLLVMIGVRADGRKELIALTDGFRESHESWADLLRDCRRRGMRAPVLAIGDGALGFWKAVREVFPETREQRCWWHKQANVLAALPKSAHPGAVAAMKEIYNAADIDKAQLAIKAFEIDYGAKYPQSGREDHQRRRRAAGVLPVSGRALDPSADHEPDRVDFRHRPVAHQGHQRTRLPRRRNRYGLQADRGRAEPVAGRQRPTPGRARPQRRRLPQGQTAGAAH